MMKVRIIIIIISNDNNIYLKVRLKEESKLIKMNYISDDAFSIGIGLERTGFAGPIRCLWMLGSSAKTRNKKDRRGFSRCRSDA